MDYSPLVHGYTDLGSALSDPTARFTALSKGVLDKGLFQLQNATVEVLEGFKNTWIVPPSSRGSALLLCKRKTEETHRPSRFYVLFVLFSSLKKMH